MTSRRAAISVLLAVVVTLSVSAGLAATVGVVGAEHGEPDADYTVEPMSDRSPGAEDVRYGQIVVGQTDEDFETLEAMKAVYEEGSWADCGPDRSEVFGIDRGNTHDGYEVDEDLTDNTKTFSAGEDVFEVEFYGEEDFGSSTHLNSGDAIVSVAKCIDNPDQPGWYQITGSVTGVTGSGERKTIDGESHYFWVCDCEDEQEAREELGPPPSEPQQTPTPEGTPAGDDTDGGTDGASGDDDSDGGDATGGSATATPSDDSSASGSGAGEEDAPTTEPTATYEAASDSDGGDPDAGGSDDSSAATATEAEPSSWDDHRVSTPTPGDGDGFGGLVAFAGLLGSALLFLRRS